MQEEQLLNPKYFKFKKKKQPKTFQTISHPIQKTKNLQRNLGIYQLDLKLLCSLFILEHGGFT